MYIKAALYLLVFYNIFFPVELFSQLTSNAVYTKSGQMIEGSIKEIRESDILFSSNQVLEIKDLLFGIQENGDILISTSEGTSYEWKKIPSPNYHRIITLNEEIFAAEKVEMFSEKIGFQDYFNGRYALLNIDDIAFILYKNDYHIIIADLQAAYSVLSNIKSFGEISTRKPASTIQLSEDEQDFFARKAEKRTEALSFNLQIITDNSFDEVKQDDAVKDALKLFYDDQRTVQVSSLNSDKKSTYLVGDYLDHIRSFSYEKVELLWNQVAFVSEIRKDSNGEYRGIISVEQLFRGYNSDNQVTYEDITQKNIEIIIKSVKIVIEGVPTQKWDVYLSDIGVKSTNRP